MSRKGEMLLFDIDDTLFDSSGFKKIVRKKTLKELTRLLRGLDYEVNYSILNNLFEEVYSEEKNSGRIFDKVLIATGVKPHEIPMCIAQVLKIWGETKSEMKTVPRACEVLEQLKALGYGLGVASSGLAIKQWDKLVRTGLHGFFDPQNVFITEQINPPGNEFAKDTAFYLKARNRIDSATYPSCTMIGDKLNQDILPAAMVGFNTVWMTQGKLSTEDKIKAEEVGCKCIKNLEEVPSVL